MKTKLQFFLAALALTTSAALAQTSKFPFDSDTKDVNKKLIATPSSAGLAFVDDAERDSKVLEFDGVDGSIELANTAYSYDAVTYNLWFKWTTSVAMQWWVRIYDFGKANDPDPGNHDVMFLTLFQDGLLKWHIHSVNWTNGSDTILSSKDTIKLNQWYMLTIVQSASEASLYLNGELQGTNACGLAPKDMTFDHCYVGKSNWPDPLFTGRMDELGIWNKSLSATEVKALYTPKQVAVNTVSKSNAFAYVKNNLLNVSVDNTANTYVSVYNIAGVEVNRIKVTSNQSEISLKSGVYIVRVAGNNLNYTTKVVIK